MEVDQQAYVFSAELPVGEQLGLVHRVDGFDAFHFDDHQLLDQEIDPVAEFEFLALIDNGQRQLPIHSQTSFR